MDPNPPSMEDRIISAAIECIEAYGIQGATNRRIAEQAGVNSAAINYYFRSKEVLVDRCMEKTLDNAFGRETFAELSAATGVERCKELFTFIIAGGCNYPGLTRAHFYEMLTAGNYGGRAVTRLNSFVQDIVDDMTAHGVLLPPDELRLACLQIASATLMMTLAPCTFEQHFGLNLCDEADRKKFLDRLVDRLLA